MIMIGTIIMMIMIRNNVHSLFKIPNYDSLLLYSLLYHISFYGKLSSKPIHE